MNEQIRIVDSTHWRSRAMRQRIIWLALIFVLLAIGRHLWSRQGEIDPKLIGSWIDSSSAQGSTSYLVLNLNSDGSAGLIRPGFNCRSFEPFYQWSVQSEELWIAVRPPDDPLGGLAEFKRSLGHYRDRLLHSEDLRIRYRIVELTNSTLKLRRLNSCNVDGESSQEYVRYQR